jgi:hypothetical protein
VRPPMPFLVPPGPSTPPSRSAKAPSSPASTPKAPKSQPAVPSPAGEKKSTHLFSNTTSTPELLQEMMKQVPSECHDLMQTHLPILSDAPCGGSKVTSGVDLPSAELESELVQYCSTMCVEKAKCRQTVLFRTI